MTGMNDSISFPLEGRAMGTTNSTERRLDEPQHSRTQTGAYHFQSAFDQPNRCGSATRAPILIATAQRRRPASSATCHAFAPILATLAFVLIAGCATRPQPATTAGSAGREEAQVALRLAEILDAAQTKDLPRLDSYHWYGPHFSKFAATGPRLDAAAAREGEHKGLSALTGLKLRTGDLKIDVFHDAAVATFTMTATFQSGADTIMKRDRGTLVFMKHEGSWKIVHEHFSALE
jgi:ketosteroid isomerase-like protein